MVDMFAPQSRAPKREAERLKTLAESLAKSGQYRGNEVVSGRVVKQSPLEHLARGLQAAAGGYFEGQAQNKADEDERMMQQRIGEALGQWGQDPQAAAMILAQDPRTSDMALQLMGSELNRQRDAESQADAYAREDAQWQRDADLKRELARMRLQGGGGGMIVDPDTGEITQSYSTKPLPVGALKLQQEALDALNAAQTISQKSQAITGQLESGELNVGPFENLISSARNWAGMSSPNSRNFQNLETDLEKIRNDSLRLNKGVQTEGDAIRAFNEVIKNKNDPKALADAMRKLDAINQRGAELQQMQINTLRENYNAAPFDFDQMGALPPAVPSSGGRADKVRQYLAGKGMKPEQIEAYIQQKGIK